MQILLLASQFGQQSYWQDMYEGRGDFPADEYSWYAGWRTLAPVWGELGLPKSARVIVPGAGNDPCVVDMYDAGYKKLTAFDYAPAAVDRLNDLLGDRAVDVRVADARSLAFGDASFDAALDKGFADAVHLSGALSEAITEMTRVLSPGAPYVCVTTVVPPDALAAAFDTTAWSLERNASDATPGMYLFRRRG